MFSRRDMLAVSAAGAMVTAKAARAASYGNPDQPPQGAVNAKAPGNLKDRARRTKRSASSFPRRSFRRRPMSAVWRWTGPPSTMRQSASRTVAGRAR
jgi:hypothetical protein